MDVVAVTAPTTKLDAHKLRADFPVFDELINGKPVAFLDSAASSQKPRQVLDRLRAFYEHEYAIVHRGVYKLAEPATAAYEGLNLVAYAWGLDNLGQGDVLVASELEHHANFDPWQYIAKRTGATFSVIPTDAQGELQLDELDDIAANGNVKVVA